MPQRERVILHVDINNCYASIESLYHPEVAGHPMAVAGDAENRRGVILAKNQLAKRYGVRTGEAIWEAKRKCPELMLLPPHHELYSAYSAKANEIYHRYTDLVEPASIDESYLDVTGSQRLFGTGGQMADDIRRVMKSELKLTVSVGVSYCKYFAKMGSDYKKPDATTIITRENFAALLYPLPVTELYGVGRRPRGIWRCSACARWAIWRDWSKASCTPGWGSTACRCFGASTGWTRSRFAARNSRRRRSPSGAASPTAAIW